MTFDSTFTNSIPLNVWKVKANGHGPLPPPSSRARAAAEALIRRTIMPVPAVDRSKHGGSILGDGWTEQRLGTDYQLDAFDRDPMTVGMMNGHITDAAGNVLTDRFADCDLDRPEAMRAAPFYLPKTGMIWGRAGKPRSHFGFRLGNIEGAKTKKFEDPLQKRDANNPDGRKATIAELRFTGWTVGPGSTNIEDGHPEDVRWYEDGDPGDVATYAELYRAMAGLSAAAELGRYWVEGVRHDWSGPLAGMLARGGLSEADAVNFMRAVCAAAVEDDDATENRVRFVRDTYAKLARGEKLITGQPELERLGCDARLLAVLREWLGLRAPGGNGKQKAPDKPRKLVLQSLADVPPERIEWLFDGYLPLGELSALAGAGGAGKTSAAIDVAVRTAAGAAMPNGARSQLGGPAGVLYITSENHPAKVLRPRMEATALALTGHDADQAQVILRRLYVQRGVVTLPDGAVVGSDERLAEVVGDPEALVIPRDLPVLRAAIVANGIRLVIIDPVISFTEQDLDVLHPADMRHVLDPLALLAQDLNIAVWSLLHFTKAAGTAVIMRIALSRQMTDTARAVGVVLEDPRVDLEHAGWRWLAMAKNNLGARPPAHSYSVTAVEHPTFTDATTAIVRWHETRDLNADALEAALEAEATKLRTAALDPFGTDKVRGDRTKEAVRSLGEHLQEIRDKGDIVVSSDELEQWRDAGTFSKETWSKAKDYLKVQTAPDGHQGTWTQELDDLDWLRDLPSKQDMQHSGRGFSDPTVDLKPPTPHRPGMPPGVKTP